MIVKKAKLKVKYTCMYMYVYFSNYFCSYNFSSQMIAVYVHLNEVSEDVVDVGSFRQKKATAWTNVIKEEQVLVLHKDMYI